MRIIEDLSDFPADIQTVLTSGTFDGVHLGHKKILRQVATMAREQKLGSVLLTYWPHPRFVLHQDDDSLKLLSTFEEKAELVAEAGIDYLVRIPFTQEFSQMEPDLFVRKVLIDHLNTQAMVIGYDHHFGKDRKGNFDYLSQRTKEFGFSLKEISKQEIDHVGVSSTKIRNFLTEGQVKEAKMLLGRHYSLRGQVVHGDKKGRSIDFPTANIWVPEGFKLIPADGSYAVQVKYGDQLLGGMVNIGLRPTVDGTKRRIEANIFNFDADLYGQELEIRFVDKLRDERKFSDLDALKAQLEEDRSKTIEILKNEGT